MDFSRFPEFVLVHIYTLIDDYRFRGVCKLFNRWVTEEEEILNPQKGISNCDGKLRGIKSSQMVRYDFSMGQIQLGEGFDVVRIPILPQNIPTWFWYNVIRTVDEIPSEMLSCVPGTNISEINMSFQGPMGLINSIKSFVDNKLGKTTTNLTLKGIYYPGYYDKLAIDSLSLQNFNSTNFPALRNLEIYLHENCVNEFCEVLCNGNFYNLVSLIFYGDVKSTVAEYLASAGLNALKKLEIHGCHDGNNMAIAIAANKNLGLLEELLLRENCIGDEGAIALATSQTLKSLIKLDLSVNDISDPGASSLFRSELTALRNLNLINNDFGWLTFSQSIIYICNKFTNLSISYTEYLLDNQPSLVHEPGNFPYLNEFNVCGLFDDDASLRIILLNSFPVLHTLELSDNSITLDPVRGAIDQGRLPALRLLIMEECDLLYEQVYNFRRNYININLVDREKEMI